MSSSIFVAEDEDDLRKLITFQLETNGYTVTTYADGKACWQELQQSDQPPDLLLTDVMMPKMDGFQLLKSIRNKNDLSDLPVIILTVRGTESDVVQGLDTGATDYLTKPFRSQELLARIRRYL